METGIVHDRNLTRFKAIGALWAIGLRMIHATESIIEQAIVDHTIIRTWPMRGTLHFVVAQDVRWMLKLLTPRVIAQNASRYRQLELDEPTFSRSKEIFVQALQGGKQLTRDELYQHHQQAGLATTGQRGYHMLVRAAQDGLICFGVPIGKEQTFTLLDKWIPPSKPLADEEALAELARRYFSSHGPATMQDLTRWAGLTLGEAKSGVTAVGNELLQETFKGQSYWLRPNAPIATTPNRLDAYLLPGFDE